MFACESGDWPLVISPQASTSLSKEQCKTHGALRRCSLVDIKVKFLLLNWLSLSIDIENINGWVESVSCTIIDFILCS